MSEAHICDRCGAVYSTLQTGMTVGLCDAEAPVTIVTHVTGEKGFGTWKRQLCHKCSALYHEFMKEPTDD